MTNRKHVNTPRKSREKLWIGAGILGLGVSPHDLIFDIEGPEEREFYELLEAAT